MEIQLKPFDRYDWMNYPGAEGEPKIAEIELPLDGRALPCQVVVDDNGINLDYWDGDTCYDFQFPVYADDGITGAGIARAEALLKVIGLDYKHVTTELLQDIGFIYQEV